MIIKKLQFVSYGLKFKTPFLTSKSSISIRKIFIIKMIDDLGNTGFGESSPLPEFGSETYEDADKLLNTLSKNYKDFSIYNDIKNIKLNTEQFAISPTIRFAVEQALLNIILSKNKSALSSFTNVGSNSKIEVNGVIGLNSLEQTINIAMLLINQGYRTIKIKAGRENFQDDLICLEAVRRAVGDYINLRIDVNGKWNVLSAAENLRSLNHLNLQFAEQPCSLLRELNELAGINQIPVAVDESIRTVENALDIIRQGKFKFLVIKPMLLGSIFDTIRIIEEANKHNTNVIISSAFESGVGREALILLASLVNQKYAHGLATADYFENDIYPNSYPITAGKILFDYNKYPSKFDLEHLFSR